MQRFLGAKTNSQSSEPLSHLLQLDSRPSIPFTAPALITAQSIPPHRVETWRTQSVSIIGHHLRLFLYGPGNLGPEESCTRRVPSSNEVTAWALFWASPDSCSASQLHEPLGWHPWRNQDLTDCRASSFHMPVGWHCSCGIPHAHPFPHRFPCPVSVDHAAAGAWTRALPDISHTRHNLFWT